MTGRSMDLGHEVIAHRVEGVAHASLRTMQKTGDSASH